MTDLDAWLDDFKPYIAEAKVCGRADMIHAHAEAEMALAAAQAEAGDVLGAAGVNEAKRRVQALEAEIEASEKRFTFQGIGNRAYQDLKRKHPPTEFDKGNGADTNMEQFVPGLIAASSLDPKVTVAQAGKMMDQLPSGEMEKLFTAALQANGQVIGPPKSGLAALIEMSQANGASSTTALPEESPDLSPSDDDDVLSSGP